MYLKALESCRNSLAVTLFLLQGIAPPTLAYPSSNGSNALLSLLRERNLNFQWTAFGDSYASGVGAGNYIDGRRCLRYDQTYSQQMNNDGENLFPGGTMDFNSVVCSGSNADDILKYQFYIDDEFWGQPNWQFYPRRSSGAPTVTTLTVGGNDIDFPGILNNCIIDGFPWPLSTGFTGRTCDQQRAFSWGKLIQNGDRSTPNAYLVDQISKVIAKINDYVVSVKQPKPLIYVTGYAQFFNADDPGCNSVTFARTANPIDDGRPHPRLTQELRRDLNAMSVALNDAIKLAVANSQGKGIRATFIDVDQASSGHRFCEPGVMEPNQTNSALWFYHYPYNQAQANDASNSVIKYLNSVAQANAGALTFDPKTTSWNDYVNEFWTKVDQNELYKAAGGTPGEVHAEFDIWGDIIGYRAKVFHPTPLMHSKYYELIADAYRRDTSSSTNNPPPKPSGLGINCRGYDYQCDQSTNAMGEIQTAMQGGISQGKGNTNYNTGQHIACYCRKDGGSVCAFFQLNGAYGSLSRASDLVKQIQDHNCANCGSVPTSGSDIANGELTVNYVSDSKGCCDGVTGRSLCAAKSNVGGGSKGTPKPPASVGTYMVVGDSITHGFEADYTWRYRIWQWYRSNNIPVNFVGPYPGTMPQPKAEPPQPPRTPDDPPPDTSPQVSGGYARDVDSDFPGRHFAAWGRQCAQAQGMIKDQVQQYQPDTLLVMLGFNDVGWFISDADGTLNSMKLFIDNARAAKPNIRFALANIPQRTYLGAWRQDLVDKTTKYNQLLKDAIPKWTQPNSPIIYVDVQSNYDCGPNYQPDCPAAYDGLHPNILGEFQIAKAFADSIRAQWNPSASAFAIPGTLPKRDVSIPSNIVAAGAPMGVAVTWNPVYGGRYEVRSRIKGNGDWGVSQNNPPRLDTTLTVAGVNWEYQIRTVYGTVKGDWSPVVGATSQRTTAPPPNDIHIRSTNGGLNMNWGSPNGSWNVFEYEVMFYDIDCTGCFTGGQATHGSSVSLTGLANNHRHRVWVRTWTKPEGGGIYGAARPVVPGAGAPAPPSGLQASNTDPTTVQLKWNSVSGAAGYLVYIRYLKDGSPSKTDQTVIMDTNYGIAYLFPGTWNYEFCVTAVNGDAESGKSNCVIPPKAPGY